MTSRKTMALKVGVGGRIREAMKPATPPRARAELFERAKDAVFLLAMAGVLTQAEAARIGWVLFEVRHREIRKWLNTHKQSEKVPA